MRLGLGEVSTSFWRQNGLHRFWVREAGSVGIIFLLASTTISDLREGSYFGSSNMKYLHISRLQW